MIFLYTIWFILQGIVALYILQPIVLWIIYNVKKAFNPFHSPWQKNLLAEEHTDFAAIVTAHEDNRFILPIVDSLLKQQYKNVHIYVVADACNIEGFDFDPKRVSLLKPKEDFHAKIKSIQYAKANFVRPHQVMVIFDADNLVHPNYFNVLNAYFMKGYKAVQTNMLPKNTSSLYACLDAMGHVYHSFLERKMKMQLGLSSHILGLGIAIDTDLYDRIMYKDALGGFDKKLQCEMVKRIPQIAFAEEAKVYDEKVEDRSTLERQRSRWAFAYFHYLKASVALFLLGLKQLNFDRIYFGFICMRPPLTVVMGLAVLFLLINAFIFPLISIAWGLMMFLYVVAFVAIVKTQSPAPEIAKALKHIPAFAWSQFMALTNMKKARKSFLQTAHSRILFIDDLQIQS